MRSTSPAAQRGGGGGEVFQWPCFLVNSLYMLQLSSLREVFIYRQAIGQCQSLVENVFLGIDHRIFSGGIGTVRH